MKKRCFLFFIPTGLLLCLLVVGVYFVSSMKTENGLTRKEKLADFDYLYNVITQNQPMLDNYKEILGFDFTGNREYYRDLIRQTKDDYEFYVMLEMIMGDFSSTHTCLFLNSYQEVADSGYNYSNLYQNKMTEEDSADYWFEYMLQSSTEETGNTGFMYYDGEYVSTICNFAENPDQTLALLAIDGEPIDEYIKRKEVNGAIAYDAFHEKVYRNSLELSLSHGQVVTATFQNMDGEVFEGEVCIRTKDSAFEINKLELIATPKAQELVLEEVEVSAVQLDEKQGGYFDIYVDETRNLSYVILRSFKNDEGELLSEVMKKACEKDNIILDLRINTGGHTKYFIDYVYPWLYEGDVKCKIPCYIYQHTFQGCVTKNMKVLDEITEVNREMMEFPQISVCEGKAEQDRKVYLLVDRLGVSAADWVAHLLKEHTSAVIIGTQTGGEGMGMHFVDIMPNSGIPFQFECAQAFNPDGTDNSIYGTTADIYCAYTAESIAKRDQIMREEGNHMSYENRLRWDNTLLETLKIIEENE